MKAKTYHMLKNIMISSAAATLYNGWMIDSCSFATEIFGTATVFVMMILLLKEADRAFVRSKRKAVEVPEEQKKSA